MKKYLFPVLISISVIFAGSLISSILYYFNITSDKVNNILIYLISISSLFTGSLFLAKNLNYKGIISGIIYFVFFFIISLLLTFILFKTSFGINNLIFYLILITFSILGGIIGKNMQTKNDVI